MTRAELEAEIAEKFREAGFDQPAFEARRLLEELGESTQLEARAREWSAQRLKGVPLAYLAGKKGFYKNEFLVRTGVLVPRPETEHVIEAALRRRPARVVEIADLGCGSGCLGLSLLLEIPNSKLSAVDVSEAAVLTTGRNAENLGVRSRTQVFQQSVESFLPEKNFDLVVANPPYIALGDPDVQHTVHVHEPHMALYSGPTGLECIQSWSAWAHRNLRPGAVFVCEIGSGQSGAAKDIMQKIGFAKIEVDRDLAGLDRVVSAIKE